MVEPVRMALIGGGWIAEQVYLPFLLRSHQVKIAGLYDVSQTALLRMAKQTGLSVEFLSRDACCTPDVDGLILCTPPAAHSRQIEDAILVGKHVLCEKPVFRSAAEVPRSLSEAQLANRLMGSASMRLREDVSLLLDWVREGRLGELHSVRLEWRRERGVPAPGSWRTDPLISPTGVLEDLGPHLLDIVAAMPSIMHWKQLRLVNAELDCKFGDSGRGAGWFGEDHQGSYSVPDQAYAKFESDRGTTAEVLVSWADDQPGDLTSIVFEGAHGRASMKGLFGFSTSRRIPEQYCELALHGRPVQRRHFHPGPQLQQQAFARSLELFIEFCRDQRPAIASYRDVAQVADWMEAIGTTAAKSVAGSAPVL
jgi:oxidoreductase